MDTRKILFVGGIPVIMTEETILHHFEQFCKVNRVRVMREKKTKESKGYAFVTLCSASDAVRMASKAHVIGGRKVDVQIASRKNEKKVWKEDQKKRKLFVTNLPDSIDGDGLVRFFRKFGEVRNAYIIYDFDTKKSKGYGYVEFQNQDNATDVVNTTVSIHNQEVNVLPYIGRHEQKRPSEDNSSVKELAVSVTEATGKRRSCFTAQGTAADEDPESTFSHHPCQLLPESWEVYQRRSGSLLQGTYDRINQHESNYRFNLIIKNPNVALSATNSAFPSASMIKKECRSWDVFGRSMTRVSVQNSCSENTSIFFNNKY